MTAFMTHEWGCVISAHNFFHSLTVCDKRYFMEKLTCLSLIKDTYGKINMFVTHHFASTSLKKP